MTVYYCPVCGAFFFEGNEARAECCGARYRFIEFADEEWAFHGKRVQEIGPKAWLCTEVPEPTTEERGRGHR